MSDFQAIGGVSASLKALLRARMEVPAAIPGGTFQITVAPPPSPPEEGQAVEPPRINLFLYRVTRNGALANQEIPGHGHPSSYGRPPLSLDLHYLLTAYGTSEQVDEPDETVAHFLLGSAMRVFHDVPVLTEELVDGNGVPVLHPSLQGDSERVKVTLDPITLEDMAKVWTATTFPYRLSAAYAVSVLQIESRTRRRHPQPVAEPPAAGPRITVLPLARPLVAEVRVHRAGTPPGTESRFPYARIGDDLVLLGSGLFGDDLRLTIGTVDATAAITEHQGDRLVATVPNHPDLQPGPQTVSVALGGGAFRSNVAVFVLVPRVDAVVADLAAVPRTFTLQGERLWAERLTGEVLVGEEAVAKEDYRSASDVQVEVPLPDTLPAWPVRCRRSGPLPAPLVVADPDLQATLGGVGPEDLTLTPTPAEPAAAALALQRALRRAVLGGRPFTGARVVAGAGRLWVVPGELGHAAGFTGPAATALQLTGATGATEVRTYLSGRLSPFPRLTALSPRLRVTIAGTTRDVTLAARPIDLADAAVRLRDALQAGGPPANFAAAEVVVLGDQLLVVPGTDSPAVLTFAPVPGIDETTVTELRLALEHRVRVRVHGAEDVDLRQEALP
ncbi:MAG TPA: Pvc16 family protein [Thermoanaerobaculia bacterium]|nr:Pvc16 family protein [Thermoanaerobaculia bacterium]